MHLPVRVRYMLGRDKSAVLAIEAASDPVPWTEGDFRRAMCRTDTLGMVAQTRDGRVAGYAIYELGDRHIRVLKLAVRPDLRRRGVGRAMVRDLAGKLTAGCRTRITLVVRETALDAQLFLASCGFQATQVLREFYGDTSEDGYSFMLDHTIAAAVAVGA